MVLNAVGNCNTVVSITIIYYIIILWDYCRIAGPSLTETSLWGAHLYTIFTRHRQPCPRHDSNPRTHNFELAATGIGTYLQHL